MKNKKISATIACYKDAQAIPIMYARLTKVFKKIGVDYEIIDGEKYFAFKTLKTTNSASFAKTLLTVLCPFAFLEEIVDLKFCNDESYCIICSGKR